VPQSPASEFADRPHPNPSPEGEGLEELAALTERAARLCKADLVTQMVGEFPELQGIIGGYYAAAQGEHPAVAAAIRDHYKPVGQGDDVPTDPVTVAVSLADKLDTLISYWSLGEMPTGSKDPFALRRAAIGVIALVTANNLRFGSSSVLARGCFIALRQKYREQVAKLTATQVPAWLPAGFLEDLAEDWVGHQLEDEVRKLPRLAKSLATFFADRLKVQQREAGVRHDLIDAVFAAKNPDGGGEDDLVRLLARVRALQAFIGTDDGANLLAGYKRAANILRKEGYDTPSPLVGEGRGPLASASGKGEGESEGDAPSLTPPHPSDASRLPPSPTGGEGKYPLSYTPEIAETALIVALDSAEPRAAAAVAAEDFEGAMAALATLRAPIDAFFDTVTVNDPDAAKRSARLALLARVRDAVHSVADFSRIEG